MMVDYLGVGLREAAILALKEQEEIAAAESAGTKSVEYECGGWRRYWIKVFDGTWRLAGIAVPVVYYVPPLDNVAEKNDG